MFHLQDNSDGRDLVSTLLNPIQCISIALIKDHQFLKKVEFDQAAAYGLTVVSSEKVREVLIDYKSPPPQLKDFNYDKSNLNLQRKRNDNSMFSNKRCLISVERPKTFSDASVGPEVSTIDIICDIESPKKFTDACVGSQAVIMKNVSQQVSTSDIADDNKVETSGDSGECSNRFQVERVLVENELPSAGEFPQPFETDDQIVIRLRASAAVALLISKLNVSMHFTILLIDGRWNAICGHCQKNILIRVRGMQVDCLGFKNHIVRHINNKDLIPF